MRSKTFIKPGTPKLIVGTMFSGKTEKLIQLIKRAFHADIQSVVFKPEKENRYDKNEVVSHNKNKLKAVVVKDSDELYRLATTIHSNKKLIAIDEGMMLQGNIFEVCMRLINEGRDVIVTGLLLTHKQEPWKPFCDLIFYADTIFHCKAICKRCKKSANITRRTVDSDELIVVGGDKAYESVCKSCYKKITTGQM